MNLDTPLTQLKGVGGEVAKKLKLLHLVTVADLIDYYPRRYDDYSALQTVAAMKPGPVTVRVQVQQVAGRYVRRGMHVTEALVKDDTGSVRLVWFNQPYRAQALKKQVDYYVSGELALKGQRFAITNPAMELASDFPVNTARIVPIYRETKGLSSAAIRKLLKQVVPAMRQMTDTLPAWVAEKHKLLPYAVALEAMHFPASTAQLADARKRLGFEEVFALTLGSLLNKQQLGEEKAVAIAFDAAVAKTFVSELPFQLTDAQRAAVWEVYKDMQQASPMNRLIEGDVGSGKTVVAAMAAVMAMHAGYQVALMAPTELLAKQHAETLTQLLAPLGFGGAVVLLTGGQSSAVKKRVKQTIASGEAKLIIGTHALLQQDVEMQQLVLVIIDEQHRFGVDQRKTLQSKAGHALHVLSMTATPIPRSLALTLYGELDNTIIKTKPAGRRPVITELIPHVARHDMYEKVRETLAKGQQAFVVCPLITESESGLQLKSAAEVHKELSKLFADYSVGLLHGKMSAQDKEDIMQEFVHNHVQLLVSTTVIEVGVHVANANCMVIEGAERFGLAQIHQLRGRVGRSSEQGYCYLVLSDNMAPSKRMRAVAQSQDGFALAELDLALRGPGAIYGSYQHGQLDLRIASLTDQELIAQARSAAKEFVSRQEDLLHYPVLARAVTKARKVTHLN